MRKKMRERHLSLDVLTFCGTTKKLEWSSVYFASLLENFEVSRHQINTILLPYIWGWLKTLWKTCHGPLRPKKTQKKALDTGHALLKSPVFKIVITVLLLRHFINRFNHPILSICSLSPGDGYTGLFCLTDSIKTAVSLICSCHTKIKSLICCKPDVPVWT